MQQLLNIKLAERNSKLAHADRPFAYTGCVGKLKLHR